MSNTQHPLKSGEVSTYKFRGRTASITVASSEPGATVPGWLEVFQNNPGEVTLKIDLPRKGDHKGTAYATMSRENAEDLCRNLAVRLGLKIEGDAA